MSQSPTAPPTAKVFEHSIRLPIPIQTVWKAVSDGHELGRWFPIEARVTPPSGAGKGKVFLSWGPACEGETEIQIWEPPSHLGWVESHEGGAVQIAVDFYLQAAAGGETVLRVVQSGFGHGAKWDDLYDSISNGWKFEFASLRHYLTRHLGQDRRCEWLPIPSPLPIEQAWRELAGVDKLVKQGSIDGHQPGDEYRFVGPDGRTYSGKVLRNITNKGFAATVRELDDALIRIEIERSGPLCMPCFWISIWGDKSVEVPKIAASWRSAIERLVS